MPLVFQVVGPSGSGKTLALEGAVRRLRRRGLRVAVLKHAHHPIDLAGKDTDRLRRSGSDVVVFASDQCVLFTDWDAADLAEVLPVDVVLVEGFRDRRFPGPRIRVRAATEADRVAARIDRAVGRPAARRVVSVAGRRSPPRGALWELVGNLMRRDGIRRLELSGAPSLRPPAERRGRPRRPRLAG